MRDAVAVRGAVLGAGGHHELLDPAVRPDLDARVHELPVQQPAGIHIQLPAQRHRAAVQQADLRTDLGERQGGLHAQHPAAEHHHGFVRAHGLVQPAGLVHLPQGDDALRPAARRGGHGDAPAHGPGDGEVRDDRAGPRGQDEPVVADLGGGTRALGERHGLPVPVQGHDAGPAPDLDAGPSGVGRVHLGRIPLGRIPLGRVHLGRVEHGQCGAVDAPAGDVAQPDPLVGRDRFLPQHGHARRTGLQGRLELLHEPGGDRSTADDDDPQRPATHHRPPRRGAGLRECS